MTDFRDFDSEGYANYLAGLPYFKIVNRRKAFVDCLRDHPEDDDWWKNPNFEIGLRDRILLELALTKADERSRLTAAFKAEQEITDDEFNDPVNQALFFMRYPECREARS